MPVLQKIASNFMASNVSEHPAFRRQQYQYSLPGIFSSKPPNFFFKLFAQTNGNVQLHFLVVISTFVFFVEQIFCN